jgi:FkbM family methyltransferase
VSLINLVRFVISHPLNREHKFRSIVRLAKWQIGSRLVPGAVVYDWVNGSKFLVRTGETGLTGNIYVGLHEFSDMGFLLHFLRRDDLFVDVGANVGSYTILACAAVGSRGVVFEPVPATYERLVENLRLNHLDERVRSINKGVAARQGTISFSSDEDTMNHVLAPGERPKRAVTVEVTSLDAALSEDTPALIKIDVEGYETPVLEGSQETLRKPTLHAVIMELNGSGYRYGFDESKILQMMLDHGFQACSYDPLRRDLLNLESKNLSSGNTLFVRNTPLVAKRLRSSPKVSVLDLQF